MQEFRDTLKERKIEIGDPGRTDRCEELFREALESIELAETNRTGVDRIAGADESGEIALDFASFLRVMGLEGSNEDYFDMEAEDLRRRYAFL